MNKEIDVRHVLPAIRVPTLVMQRSGDPVVPPEVGRYMAERIPGASLVELPGGGHLATGQAAANQTSEIERFLTGIWESGGWEEAEPDRMLATVLFTDIVGSSEQAVAARRPGLGRAARAPSRVVRRQLVRFRGQEVDTAGDGFFASFDGPGARDPLRLRCSRRAFSELGIEVRAGLHTGECELVDGKVAGIAVHIGARVAVAGAPARCSSPARSRISSPAPGSRSTTAAHAS